MLNKHEQNIEVEFVTRKDTMNTQDWVEICLQNEPPMFNPLAAEASSFRAAPKAQGCRVCLNNSELTGYLTVREPPPSP